MTTDTRPESPAPECKLCGDLIKEDDGDKVEDQFCHGCGVYICGDHMGDAPFGSHNPEDHNDGGVQ